VSMDPTVKSKWLAALRSGDFKQGQGYLVIDNFDDDRCSTWTGYCCLGVLQVVCNGDPYLPDLFDNGEGTFLTYASAERIGLTDDEMNLLAAMNDGTQYNGSVYEKHDFNAIADHIEGNL